MKIFLSSVLTLSALGCFSSRDRSKASDSGDDGADVAIDTGGVGGNATARAGSEGMDASHAGVEGGFVEPIDADNIDAEVIQGGSGGGGSTGGTGGIDIDDDAGTKDAPCAPNCPELDWVIIEGGTFIMGSPEGIGRNDEHPQHEVTVKTFKMSRTEVTVAQYGICFDAGVCSEPLVGYDVHNWGKSRRVNHPINGVDWNQANTYAEWVGARLPSEAEWEYAARSGGRDLVYPWGNEEVSCKYAVIYNSDSGNGCGDPPTAEVCNRPLGDTAQGLCDMIGNVSEWVEDDYHDSYSGAPSDGQAWIDSPRSGTRILRGGSWYHGPSLCRSAIRAEVIPDRRNEGGGFRIVLDLQ